MIPLSKIKWTKHDLIAAYDSEGSFDGAAYLLGLSERQFGKLWRDLVGAAPPSSAKKSKKKHQIEDTEQYKVAFISDLHFGSRFQCTEELHDFIKLAKKRDVKTLLCVGDLTDGHKMHADMEADQFLHKPKDILNYVVDNYPKGFDINAYITGNHDYSLQKAGCMDIGLEVAEQREDLMYLGHDSGFITLPGGLEVYLHHGTGGCAEVRSKRQQDLAMKVAVSRKGKVPHILATGHCHTENVIPNYMGMFTISVGCFQRQTPYLEGRMLLPDISGLIMTYQVIQGTLTNPSLEFIRYDVR